MKFKKTICGFMAAAVTITAIPLNAFSQTADGSAEGKIGYARKSQYVLFASGENALQLGTSKTVINGNLYTGGNLDAYSSQVDINGKAVIGGELHKHDYTVWDSYILEENAKEYLLSDFAVGFDNLLGDDFITHEYWQTYSGTDISIDTPTYAKSGLQYCGDKVTLDGTFVSDSYLMISASKAFTTTESAETNIYVKNGNIGIYAGEVSLNGVIYAPNGTVQICADNVNISGMIIAK